MGDRLAERVVIVTSGGHGIGKAYAAGLALEGAKVVIAEIDEWDRMMTLSGCAPPRRASAH